MPIARFQMPDGRIGRFEVPAGLTPQQAEQLISEQVYGAKAEPKTAAFSTKDLALSAGQGLAGGIKALTDLAGAGNTASKFLGDIQQAAGESMTPERQAEIARREEIKKAAEGNTVEEIKAVLGGLSEAPLQAGIQALFSSAPIIAGSFLAPPAAAAATAGRIGMGARALSAAKNPATGIGALMGLGGQKGQDYEVVKQELLAKGFSEPEAERLAQKAAEYSLQNLPRQAASTAVGGLEGALGIERALGSLGKAAPKVDKAAKGLPEPTFGQALRRNTLEEALPEALQASTGQVGTNVALTQAGIPTDLLQGVAAQAINDALIGGGLGAVTSPAKLSSMRKEFVANEMAAKEEYAKQEREAIAAEQAKLDKAKEQFGLTGQPLALPAPASTITAQEEAPPLQNPIGNLTTDELGPEVTRYINKYRRDNGLPFLQAYSVEDVKDAMTAVNPEGEKAALDSILTAKTGFSGTEKYTAENVIDAAVEKNVATETKGFNDFLARTTGVNNLEEMSQPQLYAAFKALKDMPENLTGQQTVLPEGSNASRFKQSQYDNAVKMVGLTFDERGGKPLSVDTILGEIKDATNLETDRDARAVLDTAVKNGDLTENKQTVYRTYKPENDQLVSTYPTRAAADAAAKKQGLNVREATLTQVAPKAAPVIPSKPRAGLPAGYDITERTFKEGEAPTGFEITPEGKGKPLTTLTNEAEVEGKIERLQGLRKEEAAKTLSDVHRYEANVAKGRAQLEGMEARGETGTEAYAKAQAQQARVEDILGRRIQRLYDLIEEFSAPLKAKPVGKKDVTRTGYTITKEGKETGTFPTREAAEESILADLSDDALDALVSDKKFGGLQNRAAAEQNRRRSAPPTTGKKASEVLQTIEQEKPIVETPESKQKVADLRKTLDKFGLGDVALQIVKAIDNQADGSYAAKVIQLAVDAQNPIRTMRHEALHALKELGFFTPQQWKALLSMARKEWVNKYLKSKKATLEDGTVVTRYEAYQKLGLSEFDIQEEAIADAFGDFDSSKAPAGMLTALLNKMRNFFDALSNYLHGRGFQSYKDIFGQIEAGKLKASPKNIPSQENAWKATPEDEEKAEKYALKNGILPYVSEGRLDLPLNTPATKFSLKTADKYGIDPVLGIPLNKDGTVTVYYHTTKDNAVKLNASKKILAEGRSRIYLTNESNGGKIVNNSGNFDQEFDGSTVLLNINPSLLQIDDVEYKDGRKDFYVPIAQGEFFNRKMNLSSIQKSRKEGIVDTFSDADMAQRMGDAVAEYNDMSPADQKARLKQVRGLLKREHNIGTLLSENGKLEKTRVGDYGLTKGDKSVASMGLGLASAQQITEKLSSCPQSAICEGLCLGETSGGNFLYGGAASEDAQGIEKSAFRAGPRMMQYLKTEALVVHPEEFAVLLNHEISMFEKWAAKETERKKNKETGSMETLEKEVYQPAIRLNVTSDFRPKMWLPIFEAHPDTMFYDYTKLNGDKVADNHHLTYSSTGVGQIIDGEKVSHKTNNWNSMRGRLDRGDNVAMAFSSKSALPDTVVDEETGKTYQVWDGDNYDARFLDPKPGEDGNLFKQGMIIGLRNKASTLKEKTASKETEGFFVEYDPKRDGKSVTILDQAQFGFKSSKKVIPIAKMSLRTLTPDSTQEEVVSILPETPMFRGVRGANTSKPVGAQYFTSSDIFAKTYSSNGKVDEHRVTLENPLVVSDSEWSQYANSPFNPIEDIEAKVRDGGYDGVVNVRKTPMGSMVTVLALDSEKATTPATKLSLREAPDTPEFKAWFGKSKIVNADGTPKVMYHGTARDISVFKPKQAKAIFLTDDPNFAQDFSGASEAYIQKELLYTLPEDEQKRLVKEAIKLALDNQEITQIEFKRLNTSTVNEALTTAAVQDNVSAVLRDRMTTGQNIMPVYVSAEKPFDYENPAHVQQVVDELNNSTDSYGRKIGNKEKGSIRTGNWDLIESRTVQQAIHKLGFDGFYVREGGIKNLAVYYPTQIKSATGNVGTFDRYNPDIRYSLRDATDAFDPTVVEKASEQGYKSKEKLVSMPITDFLKLAEFGHSKRKQDDAEQRVKSNTKFTTIPYLEVYEKYEDGLRVTGHEGRHRARALLAEGKETMPVVLRGDIRWSEQNDPDKFDYVEQWPDRIYAQKGAINEYASIPMPVTREESVEDYQVKPLPTLKYSVRNIEDEVSKLPNGDALNAAIDRLATKREQKGFIERIFQAFTPDTVDALRQQWLNRYQRLSTYDKRLAEQMGGPALLADASAESAALMSDNANAIASQAIGMSGEGGIPVFKNGYTTIDTSVKGPLELLKPLAATGDPRIYQTYQFWAGAKRGSRLLASGRDHTYTPAEIAYAKSLCDVDAKGNVTGKFPEFAQVQADWIKYNDGLVAYQVATGVLSPERAAEYTRYSDYIPFYRQFEGQDTLGPKIFQSISGVKPPKKLKGIKEEQEAPLADFLETIVRNTQAAVQAGMKNTAAQRAIGIAVQLDEAVRLDKQTARPGTVTVLENGKPVSYEVADQLFVDAVKSLNIPELPFLSILSAPANALRNLVTKDPGFMMANLMRDSLSAWVTSGHKMTPVASTISNFASAIGGKDPAFLALKRAGVIGGYEFAQDVETSGDLIGKRLRRATGTQTGVEKGLRPFNSLWEGLEKGTEASDAATRMAVYKSVMERTGNEAEAIYRAMEVMNFNRKGNLAIVRILTAAVPFLNARMQGLDVFYRAGVSPTIRKLFFGESPTEQQKALQKTFFIRGATLTALTTMYWFLTHDDEEYIRQEQEVRDNNWLLPAAGIRVPTPFEVGVLFKVIPERILEYSFGNDTGKDLSESMGRALKSTFAFNPIPQTFLPLEEARTNYSFFTGRPIVGQGMEGVAPEYQVGPSTTKIAQSIGNSLGVSPMKVDHVIQGYTGTMGMYLVDAIDSILSSNDASPKADKRFEQMPIIKRFAVDKAAKGTVSAYYDLKNSVDEVVRTVNLLERTGKIEDIEAYMTKNAPMFAAQDYVKAIESEMKALREALVQVRSSDMTGAEKKDAISELTEAQNQLTSQIKLFKKEISKSQ